ncbi:hypothetical protein N9E16_00165 [Planktomarina temperata]|nr:hypothetical protein [bacterium]MDA9971624.1 hypothetical protein [Planktomarina temperata]
MRIKFFSGSVVARALLVTNIVLGAALSINTASAQEAAAKALVMPKKYEGRCVSTYLYENNVITSELTTRCNTAGLSDIERREMFDAATAIMASDPSYFIIARTEKRRSKM